MTVYVILAICIAIPFVLFALYAMCAAGPAADDANRQAALDKAVEAAMTDAAKDRE